MRRDTRKLPESGWMGDMSRGASMGRPSTFSGNITAGNGKCSLQRVRLDSGGYDSGEAYWGLGDPLWWCGSDDGSVDLFFRARDRAAAKAEVRIAFPDARFYR